MVSSVFLSSQVEELYFIIIRIIFSISIFLHCVSLILLTKFTPPKQASWRNYMLFIQACFITMDLYMEILFIPLPLFPVPAGYTTGLLCTLKIPVQIQAVWGIAFLLISFICVSVLLCVLYRHQSILVGVHRFKLRKLSNRAVHLALMVVFSLPPISYASFLLVKSITDDAILTDPRNVTWIMQRECYFYHRIELVQKMFISEVLVLVLFSSTAMGLMFFHMNYVLKSERSTRTHPNTMNIRKSVIRLFFQLVTPMLLFGIPTLLIGTGISVDGFLLFEQSLMCFTAILLHPIAHNILLISMTPSFRTTLLNGLKCKISFLARVGPKVAATAPRDSIRIHRADKY